MEKKLTSKDFAIGDWILLEGKRKKIECGEDISQLEHIAYMLNYNEEKIREKIEPIPLTEEILEKNGFTSKTYDAGDMEYTLWSSKDERIQICDFSNSRKKWTAHIDNEDYETIGSANVDCVHELQHLLKLCEIEMEVKL